MSSDNVCEKNREDSGAPRRSTSPTPTSEVATPDNTSSTNPDMGGFAGPAGAGSIDLRNATPSDVGTAIFTAVPNSVTKTKSQVSSGNNQKSAKQGATQASAQPSRGNSRARGRGRGRGVNRPVPPPATQPGQFAPPTNGGGRKRPAPQGQAPAGAITTVQPPPGFGGPGGPPGGGPGGNGGRGGGGGRGRGRGGAQPPAGRGGAGQAPAPPPVRTFRGNAKYFRVRCGDSYKVAQTRLRELGIPYDLIDNADGVHSHPASHLVRQYCTVHALAALHRKGCRRVVSLYGSDRDLTLAAILNKGAQDPLEVIVHRPIVSPEDSHRVVEDHPGIVRALDEIQGPVDGYFMCDVYALGAVPFTPQNLYEIVGDRPVVWIGHPFSGAFGTTENEGAWIRRWIDGTEYILNRSDATDSVRSPHDPCDWLHVPGVQTVDAGHIMWSRSFSLGDTCEVHLIWTAGPGIPFAPVPVQARHDWVDLPDPDKFWVWVGDAMLWLAGVAPITQNLIPKSRHVVDVRLRQELIDQFAGRSFTPYAYRAITGAAYLKMRHNEAYELVSKLFPEPGEGGVQRIVEATALSAFLSGASERASAVRWMNLTEGRSMARYNAAVSEVGGPPPSAPWWRWIFYGIGALAFVILARKKVQALKGDILPLQRLRGWCESIIDTQHPPNTGSWARGNFDPAKVPKAMGKRLHDAVMAIGDTVVAVKEAVWKCDRSIFARLASKIVLPKIHIRTRSLDVVAYAGLNVVLSVMLEEWVKSTPFGAKWLPIYEVFEKLFYHPWTESNLLGAALAFTMHRFTLQYPSYWKRVAIHLVWNAGVICAPFCDVYMADMTPRGKWIFFGILFIGAVMNVVLRRNGNNNPWNIHKRQYFEAPWESRGPLPRVDSGELIPFKPFDGIVGRETRTFVAEDKPLDDKMAIHGEMEVAELEEATSHYVYYFLPTNIPGYAPASTDHNLNGVLKHRLAIVPPLEPAEQAIRWDAFEQNFKLSERFFHPRPPIHYGEDLVAEYISTIEDGRKKGIAIAAWEDLKKHGYRLSDKEVKEAEVFVKTDELLLQSDEESVRMKPRPIIRIHPKVQIRVAPEIMEIARRMHEDWPWVYPEGESYACGKWELRFTFGSDATDRHLSQWAEDALNFVKGATYKTPRAWIIVAGDDSLVVVNFGDGIIRFWETDFSMYDQSQSFGPLSSQLLSMRYIGLSKEAADLLKRSYGAVYKLTGNNYRWTIHHPERDMRATGGPDTTTGNSTDTGLAWGAVFWTLSRTGARPSIAEEQVPTIFSYLGFKVKIRFPPNLFQSTFLKGTWVTVQGRIYWGPLPSRILKLGKSLVDPRQLYPKRPYEDAAKQFLFDIAYSYRNFVRMPVVGAFVERFIRDEFVRDLREFAPWKVNSDFSETPGVPDDWSDIAARYDTTVEQLKDLHGLVLQANCFEFLKHPLLSSLVRADYG